MKSVLLEILQLLGGYMYFTVANNKTVTGLHLLVILGKKGGGCFTTAGHFTPLYPTFSKKYKLGTESTYPQKTTVALAPRQQKANYK